MSEEDDQRRKERVLYVMATDRPFDEKEAAELIGCAPEEIVATLKRWCAEDPVFDRATDVVAGGVKLMRAIDLVKGLSGVTDVDAKNPAISFAPFVDLGSGGPL